MLTEESKREELASCDHIVDDSRCCRHVPAGFAAEFVGGSVEGAGLLGKQVVEVVESDAPGTPHHSQEFRLAA